MKISLLEPIGIPEEMVKELAAGFEQEGHSFAYYDTKTTDVEELKRRSAGQDIVMIANNPYPDEVVEAVDSLKMIAVAFTGIDHVGLKACRDKGVTVCNCAGYSNQSVAELAIGMTIELLRKFRKCDEASRTGLTGAGLTGEEIAGKTVGIVGCGQIGFRTAKLFAAFERSRDRGGGFGCVAFPKRHRFPARTAQRHHEGLHERGEDREDEGRKYPDQLRERAGGG